MIDEVKQLQIHKKNHFIPQLYLKNWSIDKRKIWQKRLLVSNENVPEWQSVSIEDTAYQKDLYSNLIREDEIERWFDKEYEKPAQESINKLINDRRLSFDDWKKIIYFVAAQSMRTPARYFKTSEHMKELLPSILQNTLKKVQMDAEDYKNTGIITTKAKCNADSKLLPIKVSLEKNDNALTAKLKAEMVVSRGLWLFEIKYILENTAKHLLNNKWSVIKPAKTYEWITSDDPVICLNYYGENDFDFSGGWGKKGSEIICPISPQHLLYTQIGKKHDSRWDADKIQTQLLNRLTAEHAFRSIYALNKTNDYNAFRKRIIDAEEYKREKNIWNQWASLQDNLENQFYKK